jgi:hypothetical protein
LDDYLNTVVRAASTFLARWIQADVLVRELRVSPRILELVLFRSADEMRDSNLCPYFDPRWFEGPFSWTDSRITVRAVATASSSVAHLTSYDRIFEISDDSPGFCCLTESLEVKENVRLP